MFDPYAGAEPPPSLTAHLLVASPRLADPNFARRVVLILDHGMHGAIGVVLDQPGGVRVDEVLPQWHPLATPPPELFVGGPVARNAVIGLVRLSGPMAPEIGGVDGPIGGWRPLVEGERPVGTVDLSIDPAALARSIVGVRLFSGYAGWDAGQLDEEIDEGSWYVVPAQERDPISADPEGLWRRVLRRQGGALAVVSGYPREPGLN